MKAQKVRDLDSAEIHQPVEGNGRPDVPSPFSDGDGADRRSQEVRRDEEGSARMLTILREREAAPPGQKK